MGLSEGDAKDGGDEGQYGGLEMVSLLTCWDVLSTRAADDQACRKVTLGKPPVTNVLSRGQVVLTEMVGLDLCRQKICPELIGFELDGHFLAFEVVDGGMHKTLAFRELVNGMLRRGRVLMGVTHDGPDGCF